MGTGTSVQLFEFEVLLLILRQVVCNKTKKNLLINHCAFSKVPIPCPEIARWHCFCASVFTKQVVQKATSNKTNNLKEHTVRVQFLGSSFGRLYPGGLNGQWQLQGGGWQWHVGGTQTHGGCGKQSLTVLLLLMLSVVPVIKTSDCCLGWPEPAEMKKVRVLALPQISLLHGVLNPFCWQAYK